MVNLYSYGIWFFSVLLVFSVLTLLLSRSFKAAKTDPLFFDFDSPRAKRRIILFNAILVSLIVVNTRTALEKIKHQTQENIKTSLQSVLNISSAAMDFWADEHHRDISNVAANPQLEVLVEKQLFNYQRNKSLLEGRELWKLRRFFLERRKQWGVFGFFVVAPDGTSIGSMRDANIGTQNLIQKMHPELFRRVLGGETLLVLPLASDKPNDEAAMFYATPIFDGDGNTIAVLTQQLDPRAELSRITGLGRLGKSGETYVFNREGMRLSEGRFGEEQARLSQLDLAQSAVEGSKGFNMDGYRDSQGESVVGTWVWSKRLGLGLATEISQAEAYAVYGRTRVLVIAILGSTMVLVLALISFNLYLGRKATAALEATNAQLEERIRDRTAKLETEIGERKLIEGDLTKAKQVAEAAMQAKSDFLANMSHEIRTPLNAVIGMAYLIGQTQLTRKQADYLGTMQSSANLLLGTINSVLDFSKIEAGALALEEVEFQIEDVLRDVADVNSGPAREKGLELLYSCVDVDSLRVVGDPLRLAQILNNLINNAIKFTKSGTVLLRAELERQTATHAVIRFFVRDTGIGLGEQEKKKLFEVFTQADTSTTRQYGGTGLGLPICKSLVGLMGGDIDVESEPGKGSQFSFSANFILADCQSAPPNEDILKLRNMRILVVDDNEKVANILQLMLREYARDVVFAASGEEGLECLEEADEPFGLVLLDCAMPGLDGFEVCRRIKRHETLRPIPKVVMVTGFMHERLSQPAGDTDYDAYVLKPFSQSDVFDAIAHAFGKAATARMGAKALAPESGKLSPHIRGARVLLVEDSEINQQVAREILEMEGLDVSIAGNGREAIDKLEEKTFDLVLMDIQMPVMDGYETTRRLRADERFKKLPILAMTANAMEGDREVALAAGMNAHITKPIDPEELFNEIGKWIAPKAATSAKIEGLDTEAGLRCSAGNPKLYRKLLNMFAASHVDTVREIQDALNEQDYELAQRLAHTFKGVAGTIGAAPLHEAAKATEAAIKRKDPKAVEKGLKAIGILLDPLIEGIRSSQFAVDASQPSPSLITESLDTARVAPVLRELKWLLAEGDAAAGECLERLRAMPGTDTISGHLAPLGRKIGQYAFEEALRITDILATSLNIELEGIDHE